MKFELLDDKVKALDLQGDDHIVLKNQLWRVINNFQVIGGAGRMLMLAFNTHVTPQGYKFHEVQRNDERFEVFRRIE